MGRIRGQRSLEGLLLDWSIDEPLPDRRLPVALLSKAQKAAELQRVQQRRAMDAAYEAELVLGLADDTPDTLDPPAGTPGARSGSWAPDTELPGVSEFFTAELAMVLNCGRGAASHVAQRAWLFRESLPATWAALAEGRIDERRAKVLADALGSSAPAAARVVEAQVLPEAANLSMGRLKARALELLLAHDADAVDRRRQEAVRQADVRSYPSHLEGMSTLAVEMPAEVTAECVDVVDQLAAMLKADGDERPIGQLRSAVAADLLRRPWDTRLPAVTARLRITAPLRALAGDSSEPGDVNGQPITARHVRELVAQLGRLREPPPDPPAEFPDGPVPHPPAAIGPEPPPPATALPPPEWPSGSLSVGIAITDDEGRLLAMASDPALDRLARRGCREHPGTGCRCPVLGRPQATAAYSPTGAQHDWVHTRDRACRAPNCGQRAGWSDLDHVVPHGIGGATDCSNLCCLCRSHHRLKTFAPGWRFAMDADGTLHVTTPSGVTRTTRPPGMRAPGLPEPADPRFEASRSPAEPPEADPPPF